MQRISSPNYPPTRLIVPLLKNTKLQIAAGVVALLLVAAGMWILLLPAVLPLLLFAVIHVGSRVAYTNFCQDVWLDDEGFLLQHGDEQLRLPFEYVQNVTYHGSNNPPRAKIHLKQAGPHGMLYTFVPDLSSGRRQARTNVDLLNAKLAIHAAPRTEQQSDS